MVNNNRIVGFFTVAICLITFMISMWYAQHYYSEYGITITNMVQVACKEIPIEDIKLKQETTVEELAKLENESNQLFYAICWSVGGSILGAFLVVDGTLDDKSDVANF